MPAIEHPFSTSVENYAKAIYVLTGGDAAPASTSDLAARLGLSAGSVSTMVKRMDAAGLVEHVPYRGVRLTHAGERLALRIIRRHRLLELFLRESLDIPWDDVHRHAETLEHAVSDDLADIIAAKLGDPACDPHGAPIPSRDLVLDDPATRRLSDLAPGERASVVRVADGDPAMLRHLADLGIGIGGELELVARQPFEGPLEVRVGEHTRFLGPALARAIRVGPPHG